MPNDEFWLNEADKIKYTDPSTKPECMNMESYFGKGTEECNDIWEKWWDYCFVYWTDDCERVEMTIWHDLEEDEEVAKVNMQKKKNLFAK